MGTEGAPIAGLAALCRAMLPPEHGGPDPHELAVRISCLASMQPLPARSALRLGTAAVHAATLLARRRRLTSLGATDAARLLDTLAAGRSTSDLMLLLKSLVLLVAGTDAAASDLLKRALAHAPARPDPDLPVTPSSAWPSGQRCDAVVVGSGAGGAMAALTLARAGLNTVVVEEGRRFTLDEFRHDHPLQRFASLYRDAGATFALGRPPIVVPIGRGVGGTTLINSGTCYRTPNAVLERWRDEAGLELAEPDRFGPCLDEVEHMLQVAPADMDVLGNNGLLALRGAGALGWAAAPLLRNAPGCLGSCQCAIGCPRNAKAGVHLNALPQACDAGARIVSEARVERIRHEQGRATGIEIRRPDGSAFTIETERVVIAAGATETPVLLRRSGLGEHPQLGRNLSLHPAVSISGRFDEPVDAWDGVLQSVGIEEFHTGDGILIEATATPPGMGSVALPGFGPELLGELARAGHLASIGAMVADAPSGRVVGRRRATVFYSLRTDEAARLRKALRVMGRIMFAAGAVEVLTGITAAPRAATVEELDAAVESLAPRHLHLAAFHPNGTARAGSDPERYPVDPTGRLRGSDGVWVADAATLPSSPHVNPQLSIMALSLSFARQIAAS